MVTSLPNGRYRRTLDVTERFTELLARPEPEIALDEAALLIAAHAHPDLDVDARLAQLDALAARPPGCSAGELSTLLFVTEGFPATTSDYGDPRNSYLDDVLDRHLGIPITLSVAHARGRAPLRAAAARRRHARSLPRGRRRRASGSTRSTTAPALDLAGCARRCSRSTHTGARFRPQFLMPVGPRAILERMLANLQHTLTCSATRSAVVWVDAPAPPHARASR